MDSVDIIKNECCGVGLLCKSKEDVVKGLELWRSRAMLAESQLKNAHAEMLKLKSRA